MGSENSRKKQLTSFKDPLLQYIIMFILFLFAIENILLSLRYKLSFNIGYRDSKYCLWFPEFIPWNVSPIDNERQQYSKNHILGLRQWLNRQKCLPESIKM